MTDTEVDIVLEEGAYMPTRGTEGSAGMDLYAVEAGEIAPGERSGLIPTGIRLAIPKGYYGQILPRSGLAFKFGIMVLGGVIDADYRNPVYIILLNSGQLPYCYGRGERIAQIVFLPYAKATLNRVDSVDTTSRSGGFASTGN